MIKQWFEDFELYNIPLMLMEIFIISVNIATLFATRFPHKFRYITKANKTLKNTVL